jgi:hypothetical protein
VCLNSGPELDGLFTDQAKTKVVALLLEKGLGEAKVWGGVEYGWGGVQYGWGGCGSVHK